MITIVATIFYAAQAPLLIFLFLRMFNWKHKQQSQQSITTTNIKINYITFSNKKIQQSQVHSHKQCSQQQQTPIKHYTIMTTIATITVTAMLDIFTKKPDTIINQGGNHDYQAGTLGLEFWNSLLRGILVSTCQAS